jgi:transposase
MLHAGLDLSRKKLDVCLLSDDGEHLDQLVVPPDVDSLRTLARRIEKVHREPVCAVIESMTGARIVHDTLEACGYPYIPLLMSVPGIGWVLAFTIASEIGDIERFSSPEKLAGYTGLCPRVNQSGERDRRGPLTKHGPTYLRWALLEATMHALKHPAYAERYQRNKRRLGKQRGAKVAQIDIARRLAHAIWRMLTRNRPFASAARPTKRRRRALVDVR